MRVGSLSRLDHCRRLATSSLPGAFKRCVYARSLTFPLDCREEIQLVREHHPYEKEFVVESRPTGRERELPNTQPIDLLESTLREVDRSIPDVCEGAPVSHLGTVSRLCINLSSGSTF